MSEQTSRLQHTVDHSFPQRRKQEGHKLKRTYTTNYIDRADHEPEFAKNKALLYKAGYRRVQFDMPTEYRLQFSWPTDPSPLMKATEKAKNLESNKSSSKTLTNADHICSKNRKHIINGIHVNGHTHAIVKDPEENTANDKENINTMQKKVEKRITGNKEQSIKQLNKTNDCHEKSQKKTIKTRPKPNCKTKESNLSNLDPKEQHKDSQSNKDSQSKDSQSNNIQTIQPERNIEEKNMKPITNDREVNQQRSCSYPLMTEYQSNFNCNYSKADKEFIKRQFQESSLTIGLEDHVKDIIYFTPTSASQTKPSQQNNVMPSNCLSDPSRKVGSTVITPHTYVPTWVTEYSSNFVSPLQKTYVNGIWHKTQPTIVNNISEDKGVSDMNQTQAVSSWFDQVLELRNKVQEYKLRGNEGIVPSSNNPVSIKVPLQSKELTSTSTPTLSLSTLSSDDTTTNTCTCSSISQTIPSQQNHKPSVYEADDEICCSNIYVCGDCHHRVCSCQKDLSDTLNDNNKVSSESTELSTSDTNQATPVGQSTQTASTFKPSASHNPSTIYYVPSSHKTRFDHPIKQPVAPTLIHSKPKHTSTFPNGRRSPVKLPHNKYHTKPNIVTSSCDTSSHMSLRYSSTPEVRIQQPVKLSAVTREKCRGPDSLSNNIPSFSDNCNICHYSSKNPSISRPNTIGSTLPNTTIPVCPPSCPSYSVCNDDSFSLSSVSISSSCSVASDILERARHRQQNFWTDSKIKK